VDSVGILRALRRHRIAFAIGVVLAFAIAVSGIYCVSLAPPALHARASTSGAAGQRVFVDTPRSIVGAAQPRGSESIVNKAVLLGDLTAGEEARRIIARAAGLAVSEVGVIGPGALVPITATPLAEKAVEVTRPTTPDIITVDEDPGLPILSILATAPDSGQARALVEATTAALAHLGRRVMGSQGAVRIEPIGNMTVGTKTIGGKAKPLIAAFGLLVLWCSGIIVLDGLARRRRNLGEPDSAELASA
jgi:hypothetical protein